ncbi:MAG: hypothetical protein SPI18_02115 [Prevotella sp.]|nr:hypothetical protein [Prevotella sp.]
MTEIYIETRIDSDRIGSEKTIHAFQSRITCGQIPMVEHPADLFLPQNSPIVDISKYVSAIHLYTVCYKRKMSDGARWAKCRMSDGARILAGFARSVRPLHL